MFPLQAGISCMWTNDSQRILLDHFDAIYNTPSHLYHSALPLSPSSSWLHEYYITELSQEVQVVGGLPAEWGTCSRTVLLADRPWAISYWNNIIAVGSENRDILILDAITGDQVAVLPGHTDGVQSLTFSSDGTSLVSGSDDTTVKLWDVQTGGVVRTFSGHTDSICSVSISADSTTIVSGSDDMTICLWKIQMGTCYQILKKCSVECVIFSPKVPQTLLSVSSGFVQQWVIDGHKDGPPYNSHKVELARNNYTDGRATDDSHQIAFSLDGTHFISFEGGSVVVQSIDSGVVAAKFYTTNSHPSSCCFSPDGKLVAVAARYNICVWDITGSNPEKTLIGHTNNITSLAFSSPSTLISASQDKSVKFWQIGASSADPRSTPPTSAPAKSITLKTKNSPIVPNGLPGGAITTWGISTGLYKGSSQTPVNSKLIFVWYADRKINIWDAERGEILQTVDVPEDYVVDLSVSGDGSQIFCLHDRSIQAWDVGTGDAMSKVEFEHGAKGPLITNGSKVWVSFWWSIEAQGWDFGVLDSSPVKLFTEPPNELHLSDTKLWETDMSRMKDVVTGKVVFQLPQRFGKSVHVQWGGQYLVVCFGSGEALILDFSYVFLYIDP